MILRAEIIAIGDELTSGQRLDTNSQWLAKQLSDLGVATAFHTTVGDTLADNIDAFRTAARRASIVIASGGLGPTADDLTREALAEAFDRPLEVRAEALAHIEALFMRRKRPMPERNRVQAMFPAGASIIPNPHGTAPGIDLISPSGCRIFALPGVPAEMMQMWNDTVAPRLMAEMNVGQQRWFYRSLKVFGIGESDCEAMLPGLIDRDRIPRVGITVSKATITLRIACLASNEAEAIEASRETEALIQEKLGIVVFGSGEVELDDIVAQFLESTNQSLSVVEVGGSNMIASWLAQHVNRSNNPRRCGLSAAEWVPELRGNIDLLTEVSAMAERSLKMNQSDWSLAVGPYPSQVELDQSTTFPTCQFAVAIASSKYATRSSLIELGGHPELLLHRIAKTGLDFFRVHAILKQL